MLVLTKGYSITDLSAKKAVKAGYLDALSPVIAPEALRAQILAAREGRGEVFGITRKRTLVGVVILSRETVNTAELIGAHSELAGLPDSAAEVEILRRTSRCILPEHDEAICAIEESSDVSAELRSLLLGEKTMAIFYGDQIILPRKDHVGKFSVSGYALGISLGLLFGVALKNAAIGLCFGVAFAASFGMLFGQIGSKS